LIWRAKQVGKKKKTPSSPVDERKRGKRAQINGGGGKASEKKKGTTNSPDVGEKKTPRKDTRRGKKRLLIRDSQSVGEREKKPGQKFPPFKWGRKKGEKKLLLQVTRKANLVAVSGWENAHQGERLFFAGWAERGKSRRICP